MFGCELASEICKWAYKWAQNKHFGSESGPHNKILI